MRIGFVCERMLTGFGVDLCVDRLAAGLAARGHDVTVYCSVDDGTYADRPYRIRRIPVRASKNFPLMQRRAMKWAGLIDDEGLDAVEVHTFPFFGLIPRLRTPAVAVDHGISPTQGMPAWLKADFRYVVQRLYGAYLPRAAGLVTISEFLRARLPRRLRERTEVIPWGSEHYARSVSPAESLAFRRANGIGDDAVLALYVGRLNHAGQPYKGVEELLGHFAAIRGQEPRAALLCVGFGDHADASEIRRAGGVALLKAPTATMPLAYAAADIFVSASKWEGFGLPLLEAQQAGVAAVAYAAGAHPEIADAGTSALLVGSPGEFREAWRSLVDDPALRRSLGESGREFAARFSWDRAVSAHEAALQQVAREAATARPVVLDALPDSEREPVVSVIVLTYRPDPETLNRCLESVAASDYPRLETVVVDNGSGDDVARVIAEARPGTVFVGLERNTGFSGGINQGIAASTGSLCFILNPDTEVDRRAVAELVAAARRRPSVAGFAPKMLFIHDRELIDSVGIAIDPEGAAFNRGIGQLDIGQYDIEEPVVGACFGAALIRREAFQPHRVGLLDERFFLYYEDVDWSVRATLLGEDFWSVPAARVFHVHSATTRDEAYAFKFRLIERNLLATVWKNFERRRTVKIFVRRYIAHSMNLLRRQFPLATIRIMLEGAAVPVRYRHARRSMQRRRVRADVDLYKLSHGEFPHFDPQHYSATYDWPAAQSMIKRLSLVTGEERWERALTYCATAFTSPLRFRPLDVLDHLEHIAGPLPAPLVRFFEEMARQPGMLPERVVPARAAKPGGSARTA